MASEGSDCVPSAQTAVTIHAKQRACKLSKHQAIVFVVCGTIETCVPNSRRKPVDALHLENLRCAMKPPWNGDPNQG